MKILKEYQKIGIYFRESKRFIYISAIIYFLALIIGMAQFSFLPDMTNLIISSPSLPHSVSEIFYHNLGLDVFKIFGGIIFGIIPLFLLILNGYAIGFAITFVGSKMLNPIFFSIFTIIATMELSITFLSAGLGLRFATIPFGRNKLRRLKYHITNSLRIFLLIIVPLLFASAFLENLFIGLM